MSKSLGNFYTLRDLIGKGWTGREIRWVLIGAHYRKKLNFTLDALAAARDTLGKFDDLFNRMRNVDAIGDGSEIAEAVNGAKEAFANAMADDLNISEALAAMFDLQRTANRLADSGKLTKSGAEQVLASYRDFDRIVCCLEVDVVREQPTAPAEVIALAEERAAARRNKDFAASDRLRDEIAKLGYQIKDVPGGKYELTALK